MTVRVSVVTPTYRRPAQLAACLERLVNQTLPPSEYEIIIADDEPSLRTRDCVEAFRRRQGPSLTWVPVTRTQGPAAARNAGWRRAAGEIIAFTDDDCLPDPDWLRQGLAAIAQADAVSGRTVVPLPPRPTDFQRNVAGLASADFITANCFVRRAALEAVGGFDERFTLAWREDSDLEFALLTRGFRIVRTERAVVVHPARSAPWGVCLRQQRQGMCDPLLYRKFPELYRRRIPPLPRSYYFAVASLAAVGAAHLADQPTVALVSLAVWLGLTGRFIWRRLRGASLAPGHVLEMAVTSPLLPWLSIYWRLRGAWKHRVAHL